jgi:hypothetical protein
MSTRCLFLVLLTSAALFGQLTGEQRLFEFQTLANLFAKNYAPYEWKRDRFGADIYDTRPWADRIRQAGSDLEAIEIMSQYVAELRDGHAQLYFPSIYRARLGFNVDLYDGKPLVEVIDRMLLPAARFPIQIGDELIAIDGRSAEQWIDDYARLLGMAEERSRRRLAAQYITDRFQQLFPRAFEHGDNAQIQILHQNGETATYTIPWVVTGVPFRQIGPVPSPKAAAPRLALTHAGADAVDLGVSPKLPLLRAYHDRRAPAHVRLRGWGSRNPYYALPDNFSVRLGTNPAHFHFSGVYSAGGKRIGLLRIPSFAPPNSSAAINEMVSEVIFMNQNTDALVVDITRNTGGGCYGTVPLQLLIPYRFQLPGDLIRPSLTLLAAYDEELTFARLQGAPAWEIALLENIIQQLRSALRENRGLTGPLPFCSSSFDWNPVVDRGVMISYQKPILLLTDEFTFSWGDVFAAVFMDSDRGTVFGYRTQGAGGSIGTLSAGSFSDMIASFSFSLGVRQRSSFTSEYGETDVLENAGIRPHAYYDFMTRENLVEQGRPFVRAFTAAILAELGVR